VRFWAVRDSSPRIIEIRLVGSCGPALLNTSWRVLTIPAIAATQTISVVSESLQRVTAKPNVF
jgi:hypothetical protein